MGHRVSKVGVSTKLGDVRISQALHWNWERCLFCLPSDLDLLERDTEKFHIFQQLVWNHQDFREVLQSICVPLSSLLRYLSYPSIPYLFLSLPNKNQQACSSESMSVLQLSSLAELSILSAAVEGKPADFAEPAE